MDAHESIFGRIETALKALDASTDTHIKAVDERLQTLGVTVETFLDEPVDVWKTTTPPIEESLHLGYARNAGRWGLTLKRVRCISAEAPGKPPTMDVRVQPLREADRAARIAVVDKLPDVLQAVEAELTRRNARIATAPSRQAAPPQPRPEPKQATPARAEVGSRVAVAVPAAPEAALPVKVARVPLPPASEVDAPLQAKDASESVDHMFRLFGRKGR